jgi:TPR repeat protein
MIHPRLQAGVELQLDKEAVSVFDEDGEFARFDPLFYDDDFDDTDPAALAEVIRHFRDVSKANSYKSKIFVTTDEDQRGYGKEVDPAEAEKELRRMAAAGEKLDFDSPGFPDYYSVQYPRGLRKRIAAVIKKDPPEDSDEWDFGLSAIDQALDAYRAGKEKKAAENTPADDPSDDMDATIEKIEEDFHAGLIDQAEAMKRFNMAMWGDEGKWTDENIAANSAEKKASWTDIGITGYLQGYLPKTAGLKAPDERESQRSHIGPRGTEQLRERAKALKVLAVKGDSEAQFELGELYNWGDYQGKFLEGGQIEAAKWWRKAAEQGHAEAQYALGYMHTEDTHEDWSAAHRKAGWGLSDAEAVKWYRKAADQGHAAAQNDLGAMYSAGKGVPQDDTEAEKWYIKSEEETPESRAEGVNKADAEVIERTRQQAEAFMQDKTRLKYVFFGPKVTKKVWGVDMLGQRMDPDYFMPDYKPKGFMVRTEGPDPLNRYHPSVHDAPIGMVYY